MESADDEGYWARSADRAVGAECPRAVLSGAAGAPPSSEALAGYWGPYVKTCIDLFGPDRCMVESNYPVEKMGIGMPALWNMFKRLTAGASAAEKKAIFSGTANRVYRLGLVD